MNKRLQETNTPRLTHPTIKKVRRPWIAILLTVVALLAGGFAPAPVSKSDATIQAVFLAQTHVMRPDQPYFRLTGNREALVVAHVVSPSGAEAPQVTAIVRNGAQSSSYVLQGPKRLPISLPTDLGALRHSFDEMFTVTIPKEVVRKGMSIELRAGSSVASYLVDVGAPTVVKMLMFDVHYFGLSGKDYPDGFLEELASKWPVSGLEIERVRNLNFTELVIPARGDIPAVRISSPADYRKKTGHPFDGEQAAALEWVHALAVAGGNLDTILTYVNILGVNAGGQAGNFKGVGGTGVGIMHHELGHALGLPHNENVKDYPYQGEMYGIKGPAYHAGPTWAYDSRKKLFIPPTVQPGAARGTVGQFKADPMQGGGQGDQERGFLLRHFADFNVFKMQRFLENRVAVSRKGKFYKWDETSGDYSREVNSNGIKYPIELDVPVISVMASISLLDKTINMIYPPIGPYKGNLIKVFDPTKEPDRERAREVFSPSGGCDFTLRITQGSKRAHYLLAASAKDPKGTLRKLSTAAVNLRASDGPVTSVDLLYTPSADVTRLQGEPEVLARWQKE